MEVISFYRVALSVNKEKTLKAFAFFQNETVSIGNNQVEDRDATWHLIFVTELYAKGYETVDIKENDESVQIALKDMYDTENIEKRATPRLSEMIDGEFFGSLRGVASIEK